MNRVFSIVWHRARRIWVVVGEFCGPGKNSARGSGARARRMAAIGLLVGSAGAHAQLPGGGVVVTPGRAWIAPSGDEIYQSHDRAIINWDSFSIGASNHVRFHQENPGFAILNRVTGQDPSNIAGQLTGDGAVWLINPNGILIGSGARIETQSFIASTLDVDDNAFLSGAVGTTSIDMTGNSAATIDNQGTVEALGGDVILVARRVSNEGTLKAPQGRVMLGAGNDVTLTLRYEDTVSHGIEVRSAVPTPAGGIGVDQQGVVEAVRAELAAAGGNIYSLAVNVGGSIDAHGMKNVAGHEDHAGRIYLTSEDGRIEVAQGGALGASGGEITISTGNGQGAAGEVVLAGTVDAGSDGRFESRGEIRIEGERVELSGTAALDVSGHDGGDAGLIDIRSFYYEPIEEVVVSEGAAVRAEGGNGSVELAAERIVLDGEFAASDGRVRLSGTEEILGDGATIRVRELELSGDSIRLAGGDNAIRRLRFGHRAGGAGNVHVDSGEGALSVGLDGEAFQTSGNLVLLSDGNLSLEESFVPAIAGGVTLASRGGSVQNHSAAGAGVFGNAERVRLYAAKTGDLGGIQLDETIVDVAYPDNPNADSQVVLYLRSEQPSDPPAPDPEQYEEARETLEQDQTHAQQPPPEPPPLVVGDVTPSPPAPLVEQSPSQWDTDQFETLAGLGQLYLLGDEPVATSILDFLAAYLTSDQSEPPEGLPDANQGLEAILLKFVARSNGMLTEQDVQDIIDSARGDIESDIDLSGDPASRGGEPEDEAARRRQHMEQQRRRQQERQEQERERREQHERQQQLLNQLQQQREQQQNENREAGGERSSGPDRSQLTQEQLDRLRQRPDPTEEATVDGSDSGWSRPYTSADNPGSSLNQGGGYVQIPERQGLLVPVNTGGAQ